MRCTASNRCSSTGAREGQFEVDAVVSGTHVVSLQEDGLLVNAHGEGTVVGLDGQGIPAVGVRGRTRRGEASLREHVLGVDFDTRNGIATRPRDTTTDLGEGRIPAEILLANLTRFEIHGEHSGEAILAAP